MTVQSSRTRDALSLLGVEVARRRRAQRWTAAELAARVGVTEKTLRKVEKGDPTVAIGTAFEAAVLVGVPLFGVDSSHESGLKGPLANARDRLALLPARVDSSSAAVHDDF